ncbi:MAG: DNA replication/repair protein RecF [Defluviitaleaceae bacterium]|nr:DNA replication/repair protein RecF [Defluviitaleaceae bacterium]
MITNIKLTNFRNIESLYIEPCPGINILHGDNAQGKTNILEAIYICATGRSHRAARDRDLVLVGEHIAQIALHTAKDRLNMQIRAKDNGQKSASINGLTISRLGDLIGIVNIVIFSPEDLSLIKAGPNLRRRFMDMELCQIYPNYYFILRQYYRVLRQRNNLLKELQKNPKDIGSLEIWDEQLVEFGCKIMEYRRIFFAELQNIANEIHSDLTYNSEDLEIIYKNNIASEIFMEKLTKARDNDIFRGTTGHGIHRDDARININGRDAQIFASQGQQRTAALALKLSEAKLIENETGQPPVMLLDDVFSELDTKRQKYLMDKITNCQVFLTATGHNDFAQLKSHPAQIYIIKEGKAFIDTNKSL